MKQENISNHIISQVSFFPRIIREFDDHDEPMIYGVKP